MRTLLMVVGILAVAGASFAAPADNFVVLGGGDQAYNGTLSGGWSGGTPGPFGYATKLDLSADVEMWGSEWLAARTINYHWGRPDQLATQNGDVAATLSNNFDLNLSVEGDAALGCNINQMVFVSGPSSAVGAPISVAWSCNLNNGSAFRPCVIEGNSAYYSTDGVNKGVVTPGSYSYAWRAAATVPATQAAGHYTMDPTICLTPVLN